MINYEVTIFTSGRIASATLNNVSIKLVGTEGESDRSWLTSLSGPLSFITGAVASFTVSCPSFIGKLVLIELDKQPLPLFPEDDWFPAKVQVKSPDGQTYDVPIYRWINDKEVHRFREGTARRLCDDDHHLGIYSREQELKQRKEDYRWDVYGEGMPHCMRVEDPLLLPCEVRFSFTKTTEFLFTLGTGLAELGLKHLACNTSSWTNIDDIDRVFCYKRTKMSEYVQKHWKEDAFFGYQFLNGPNPMMIRCCKALPANFPVTDDMVFPRACGSTNLAEEMKKGNIFLCDYKHLDGVKTNTINGKRQFLMAPLVLFHKTPDDKLMPIAIQLKQEPGKDNPIFLPTDSEYDWLLAKIFVRSADFSEHQLNVHLLRTHLLAEVFAVSLLRNLPMVHPLYKLLIPHTRYTLQINCLARSFLISPDGVFTDYAASGGDGMFTILRRSMSSVTYRSLCIPEDIADRGMKDVPNFYYRDDGLRLWDIIHKFVEQILGHYYKNDEEVQQDAELQLWISDIFEHGFLSRKDSGIPQKFTTVTELIKFVTMVIFTGSGQHAAVNSGQYDYGGWMPNTPPSLQLPPPAVKGKATEATMLKTFPDINATVNIMATVWLLSRQSSDFVSLGKHPEDHFCEEAPIQAIKDFQRQLYLLSVNIKSRNEYMEPPYKYMDPAEVENSVGITTCKMVNYEVTIFTSDLIASATLNNVSIKLVGTEGETEHSWLMSLKGPLAFIRGAVASFTVPCPSSIGKLVLIELDKQPLPLFPEDDWFPAKVQVKSPEGQTYDVPIHKWIDDKEVHRFREGTARRLCDDDHHLGIYSREQELKQRKEDYCWDVFVEGMPHCMRVEDPLLLHCEVRFSFTKETEFLFTAATGLLELRLKGLADNTSSWTNTDDIHRVFCYKQTELSEYVQKHWKEDAFFGYQFLNGANPMMIRCCQALPRNFPVTDDMVFPCGSRTLAEETKKGNIFLCDYKHLDGLKTNTINGKRQFLMAPLVLLHKTPDDKLMPLAIQLKQKPGKDNPIFLPTDSEYDWLLAKIFVRSADFSEHQLNVHLLRTHLLAEVFAVSLLRNLPMVHPLYKLLIPHTRYTLQINCLARKLLISPDGIFTKFTASGGDGMFTILRRSMSSVTYRSLCIPEDIADRGMKDVPNFYYRDDGLRLWDIIHKFVEQILGHYYKNDEEVQQDAELQLWISDIFEHGFLSRKDTGIPQEFTTVTELIKFVTMVIFTCSGQHAAVNSGQYDYGGWMPNSPTSLQLPPPAVKGKATEATMLKTFPDVNTTVQGMATVWLLSRQSSDFVPLGEYPEDHFCEEAPIQAIKDFQRKLSLLSVDIKSRNKYLEVPYKYMDPAEVENSVGI
ncbi:uncharacterized protein ACNS7B_007030 [Menidia menidia]